MAAFEGCALKQGARNLVFADGDPRARLMVIGEAPGRDEDREGLPFVGRSGQLLDRMLAAIGLSRRAEDPAAGGLHHQRAAVAAAAEPRPVGGRGGDDAAVSVQAHRAGGAGGAAAAGVAGGARRCSGPTHGVTRLRGRWHDWRGVPVLATFHPAALLRDGSQEAGGLGGPAAAEGAAGGVGVRIDRAGFVPVRIAVLTVSDTRGPEDDRSGDVLVERLQAAGHVLADRAHRAGRAGGDRGAAAGLDRRSGGRRGDLDRRHRADRARRDGRGARGGLREGDPGVRHAFHA